MSDSTNQDKATDYPAVETLTFEQAQEELEQVVEKLEDRHTSLDDALALWERGEALHKCCQKRLDYAAERLQKITLTSDEVAESTSQNKDLSLHADSDDVDQNIQSDETIF